MREYRRLRIEYNEDLESFFDRVYTLLTQPTISLTEGEIVKMAHSRMPSWVQEEIEVFGRGKKVVKKLLKLRKAIRDLANDTTR